MLDAGGRRVPVSSLDRVLYPRTGFTKADLIVYYLAVAGALLPYLRGRPLTLHRYPEGMAGPHFFQTRCPPHPPWLRTARLSYPRTGKSFDSPVIDDVAGLVWAGNLAAVELHPFLGRLPGLDRPTDMVFDLDPGAPAGLAQACAVALRVRELLDRAGLAGRPKVSGGKGVHVHAPLPAPAAYAETKAFARGAARTLARQTPDAVVDAMPRQRRAGRVFVDWSQNDPGKSTVAPYSLRGGPVPRVAAPVSWAEIEDAAAGRAALVFSPGDALARLRAGAGV